MLSTVYLATVQLKSAAVNVWQTEVAAPGRICADARGGEGQSSSLSNSIYIDFVALCAPWLLVNLFGVSFGSWMRCTSWTVKGATSSMVGSLLTLLVRDVRLGPNQQSRMVLINTKLRGFYSRNKDAYKLPKLNTTAKIKN